MAGFSRWLARLSVGCGVLLGLTACGDGVSDSTIERQIGEILGQRSEELKCMNRFKIKNARTNRMDQSISASVFPVIFAEEAFIAWDSDSELVMLVLLGEGYIGVHKGGYPQSTREPGKPGELYRISSFKDAQKVVADIKQRGAVVELTEKGSRAHAWDDDNFCLTGRWVFHEVLGKTDPAPDNRGRTVTNATALLHFKPEKVGRSAIDNPLGTFLEREVTIEYTKYSDGWRMGAMAMN